MRNLDGIGKLSLITIINNKPLQENLGGEQLRFSINVLSKVLQEKNFASIKVFCEKIGTSKLLK